MNADGYTGVLFQAVGTKSNRAAIGARVTIPGPPGTAIEAKCVVEAATCRKWNLALAFRSGHCRQDGIGSSSLAKW